MTTKKTTKKTAVRKTIKKTVKRDSNLSRKQIKEIAQKAAKVKAKAMKEEKHDPQTCIGCRIDEVMEHITMTALDFNLPIPLIEKRVTIGEFSIMSVPRLTLANKIKMAEGAFAELMTVAKKAAAQEERIKTILKKKVMGTKTPTDDEELEEISDEDGKRTIH